MPAKRTRWTTKKVLAWLAENRPDFKPAGYWFYTKSTTPIPGTCLVCDEKCAPRLNDMKSRGTGHCHACGSRTMGEKQRARGEAEARRVAAARGYTVLSVYLLTERDYSKKVSFRERTWVTLRCDCGNVWDVSQSDLCSKGRGCGNCAEFGYSTDKPGAIYLLARSVDGVEQRGYGISNDWPTRIKGYEKFDWLPLDVMEFSDGETARNTESMLNRVVAATAGRSVEPDSVYYKNKEAWSEGNGIPMFNSVWAFLCWAAPIDARELQDA